MPERRKIIRLRRKYPLDELSAQAYNSLMNTPTRKGKPQSLAAWRAKRGLTLEQAGRALGYSESGYWKLERGQRVPRGGKLLRVHLVTGVEIAALLGRAS